MVQAVGPHEEFLRSKHMIHELKWNFILDHVFKKMTHHACLWSGQRSQQLRLFLLCIYSPWIFWRHWPNSSSNSSLLSISYSPWTAGLADKTIGSIDPVSAWASAITWSKCSSRSFLHSCRSWIFSIIFLECVEIRACEAWSASCHVWSLLQRSETVRQGTKSVRRARLYRSWVSLRSCRGIWGP